MFEHNASRRYPIDNIRIRWSPQEGDEVVRVFVVYPSYSVHGLISVADAQRIIEYGKMLLKNVFTGEDDTDRMLKTIEDMKRGMSEH